MSTHRQLREAETSVLEQAISFVKSPARVIPTNLRRMSVDADHYGELAQACLHLVKVRLDLDGDGAHNDTDTSILASKLPGKGTLRRQVLNALLVKYMVDGDGMTTDAMEIRLGRPHTSVSSAMNSLVNRGLVGDAGLRRDTRAGSPAIVYAPTEWARELAIAEVMGEEHAN